MAWTKEERTAYNREYYAKNKEALRAKQKEYVQSKPERIKEYNRTRAINRKSYMMEYRRINRERLNDLAYRRRTGMPRTEKKSPMSKEDREAGRRASMQKFRETHKEKLKIKRSERTNLDKENQRARCRREDNREKYLEIERAKYAKYRLKIQAKNKNEIGGLADRYVKSRLRAEGFGKDFIKTNPILIETKRIILKTKRL